MPYLPRRRKKKSMVKTTDFRYCITFRSAGYSRDPRGDRSGRRYMGILGKASLTESGGKNTSKKAFGLGGKKGAMEPTTIPPLWEGRRRGPEGASGKK